jgi:hypothetical protein
LRHEALPTDLLTGPLAELGLSVPVSIALPPPEDRSFADVWSALGGELKPSLDLVVSAPTATGRVYEAATLVDQPPRVSMGGTAGWPPREDAPNGAHRNGQRPNEQQENATNPRRPRKRTG